MIQQAKELAKNIQRQERKFLVTDSQLMDKITEHISNYKFNRLKHMIESRKKHQQDLLQYEQSLLRQGNKATGALLAPQ